MDKLKFADLRTKKSFMTNKYRFVSKKGNGRIMYFAIAKAPSGVASWRIVSKDFYNKFK